jgi:Ca2+-binding RTX toxin-like protein
MDSGSDLVVFATSTTITSSSVFGGSGNDSLSFLGIVGFSTIDAGADNDSLYFSSTVSTSTILGGTGNDTINFAATVTASKVSLDSGADSLVFNSAVTNSTIVGGTGIQTIQFSSSADVVSLDGIFGAGLILGGSGNDDFYFLSGAEINASTKVSLDAGNDLLVFSGNTLSGQFGGGGGADSLSGSVTIGASGVSFWGGAGNDTFNFTTITGSTTGSTAYFWNDAAGTDSLVFNSVISGGAVNGYAAAIFGISVGLGSATALDISFAAGQTTNLFGTQGETSNAFILGSGASTLVSFGFGSTSTTIIFNGGNALATLQGGAFETATGTNIFTNASATTLTANFGIASIIPTFS